MQEVSSIITAETLIILQHEAAHKLGTHAGVANAALLDKLIAEPFAGDNGLPRYPTLFNKVAVLIQGIVHGRPFLSVNRETALAAAVHILNRNGYTFNPPPIDTEATMAGVETGFTTWQRLTRWLKKYAVRRNLPPQHRS